MKVTEQDNELLIESDNSSLLDLLLNEAVDRSSYDMAMKFIEPLSELEDIISKGSTPMPNTQRAIRDCIRKVNTAITASPDPILSALQLSNSQKQLVDAITACEVLKLSILNAMDAVRMNFITDFKKELKFYTDEVIAYNVLGSSGSLSLSNPQRQPFSKVKDLGDYETIRYGTNFMIIGPEATSAGGTVVLRVPGTSLGLQLRNVSSGKIYLTGRDSDGDPSPIPDGIKSNFLGISAPARGIMDDTIYDLSNRTGKSFNLRALISDNFRVPAPAEGMLTSIYRLIRKRPAIQPPSISPSDFADDIGNVTLGNFKKYFEAIVSKTEGTSGDMVTYDTADALFFGGLATVSGALGLTRKPPPPPSPDVDGGSSPGAARAGARGAGGGSGTGGGVVGGGGRQHSFDNFIRSASMVKGSTPAEKAANLNTLLNIIDKSGMRQELNRVVGPNVVFTESTVDRWSKLAGIKEGK